ncbi:MAG: hypothetical protein A2Z28_08690 [Chloroflexi bacterium RBG_16_51_9]|nr:MAG: hypothetical protein A2Z28_08690 [Chloroflexi bacterium RBG_16_51_9]
MTPTLVVLFSTFAVQFPVVIFLTRCTSLGVYGSGWALVAATVINAAINISHLADGMQKLMDGSNQDFLIVVESN